MTLLVVIIVLVVRDIHDSSLITTLQFAKISSFRTHRHQETRLGHRRTVSMLPRNPFPVLGRLDLYAGCQRSGFRICRLGLLFSPPRIVMSTLPGGGKKYCSHPEPGKCGWVYSIFFYFLLFYSILFQSILFYSILFYSIFTN